MEGEDYSKGYSDGLKSHDRKIDRLRQEFNRQIEELQDDFKHRLDTLTRKIERSERGRGDNKDDGEAIKRAVRAIVDTFNNFWLNFLEMAQRPGNPYGHSIPRLQYPPGY
jgi:hypothetical protein